MNLRKIIRCCVIHIVITISTISTGKRALGNQLVLVSETIKRNFHTSRTTVLVESAKKLSPASSFLVGQLLSTFSCAYSEMYQLENFASDRKSTRMLKLLCEWSEREIVKTVIVDAHNEINVEKRLVKVIDFLVTFSPKSIRPQCLIILVRYFGNTVLSSFFEYAWMYNFLDITVLQIITEQSYSTSLSRVNFNILDVKFHTYNPFNKTYTVKTIDLNVDIFHDKLANLHKTTLKVSFFSEFPDLIFDSNYTGDNLWSAMKGRSVYLMNEIAKSLNFSIKITAAWDNYYNLSRYNVSYDPNATNKQSIDFVSPALTLNGNLALEEISSEFCCLLEPNPNHVIVRQYSMETSHFSFGCISVSIIGMAMIIFLSVLLRRRYKNEFWDVLNTAKILLRIQVAPAPNSILEKSFLLSLTCLSFMFVEQILESFLNVYLVQDNYRKLETLQDLIDSGIIPSISKYSKDHINPSNYTVRKILSSKSKTLEFYGSTENCVWQLIHGLNRIEGCEINRILGRLAVRAYSKVRHGSILTLVEEPLSLGLTGIPFSKTSPYVRRVDRIAHRLYDAGLVDFFHKSTMSRLSLDRNKFYYPGNFPQNYTPLALRYEIVNMESSIKNLFILVTFAYMLSCFSLVIEVILKKII